MDEVKAEAKRASDCGLYDELSLYMSVTVSLQQDHFHRTVGLHLVNKTATPSAVAAQHFAALPWLVLLSEAKPGSLVASW